jgi:hypothetical protein
VGELPRRGRKYVSYQLLRNVPTAHALDLSFCLLLDARRPDLIEDFGRMKISQKSSAAP